MPKNKQPDDFSKARNYAFRLLARSQKTAGEVTRRLLNKGFGVKTVDEVVGGLKSQNYINDMECAMDYIESRLSAGMGRGAIRHGLKGKGFSEEEAPGYIEEYYKNRRVDENELARAAISKKFANYNGQDKRKLCLKIKTFLAGRGFLDETISGIIEEQMNK